MKKKRRKKIIAKFFKLFFLMIYFLLTALIPICVFGYMYIQKDSIIPAIALGFATFIVMDIVCSSIEDISAKIDNRIREAHLEKQKLKEEAKQLEDLLTQTKDYTDEIKTAKKSNSELQKSIEENIERLPKKVSSKTLSICNDMDDIIKILKEDPEEYYSIRHTFTVYFPEFKRMTYKLIELSKTDSIDKDNLDGFMILLDEIEQYLEFIKSQINKSDRISLNVEMKALTQSLEAERKKVEK